MKARYASGEACSALCDGLDLIIIHQYGYIRKYLDKLIIIKYANISSIPRLSKVIRMFR